MIFEIVLLLAMSLLLILAPQNTEAVLVVGYALLGLTVIAIVLLLYPKALLRPFARIVGLCPSLCRQT